MKKFIIFAVLICVLCTLSAQKGRNFKVANRFRSSIESNRFSNSIEFSAGGGFHGLSLIQKSPCDGFNFKLMGKFSMGYHFTPVLGARFTLKGGNTMSDPKNIPGLTVSMDPLIHTSVDLLVNLTNLWKTRPNRNIFFTNKSFCRIKLCDRKFYILGNPTIVFGAGVVTFRQKDVKVRYSNLAFNGGFLLQVVRYKGFSFNVEVNIALSNNAVSSLSNSEVIDSRINGWISTADIVSFSANFKIPTKHKNQRHYYTGGRRY